MSAIAGNPAFDEAVARQRAATDPTRSVWLAANAGSGKTYVLTDRLARLLLAGVRPAAILCLTFTKAAAAEMNNRLFAKLAKWATCNAADLTTDLTQLLGHAPAAKDLTEARRLFALTLDAPGGVRIQTIHAFCESLLKRFPLEAGVPPQFKVADEAISGAMLRDARNRMLEDARHDAALNEALERLVAATSEASFDKVLDAIVKGRARLAALRAATGSVEAAIAFAYAGFGADPRYAPDDLTEAHMRSVPDADMARVFAAMEQGTANERSRATKLRALLAAPNRNRRFKEWAGFLLTNEGERRKTPLTNGAQAADRGALELVVAEQARTQETNNAVHASRAALHSAAAIRVGESFLAHYEQVKQAHALLDYDDLIRRAGALLADASVAAWVLYRLDAGLDHVLVDEAQDTNPEQWAVIHALSDSFFHGEGAREGARNLFVVGDIKQSIFSFQGADPRAFAEFERLFRARAEATGHERWKRIELQSSFRSVPLVLEAVDTVFAEQAAQAGVVTPPDRVQHRAIRANAPGLIEHWPVMLEHAAASDDAPWDAPLDYRGSRSAPVRLAEHLAAQIKTWLASTDPLPYTGRPPRPGDIMILVRRRDILFEEIVRALKRAGVAVAGADRMNLASQLVVQDLVAIAAFALQPQDDLTLATVLKGPLYQFSEERLFELAHGRRTDLWRALGERSIEHPDFARARSELGEILALADYAAPYEFFAHILSARGGRERIMSRMGDEVAEAIDEFLDWALMDERESAPSLQGFVHRFRRNDAEIKRDLQQSRDEVRILTVHGAKGLEAPIVIMPDTCRAPGNRNTPPLFWLNMPLSGTAGPVGREAPLPVWPSPAQLSQDALRRHIDQQQEEYHRLLYVALTRARDRLYIAGWAGTRGRDGGSWHAMTEAAFAGMPDVERIATPDGDILRLTRPGHVASKEPEADAAGRSPAPPWLRQPAPPEPEPTKPLTPSRTDEETLPQLGPFAAAGDDTRRFQRGRLVHRLLQTLPDLAPERRAPAAGRFLAVAASDWAEADRAALVAEVLALFDDPAFASVFGPGSRAEAPITGRAGSRFVSGRIDRLVIRGDDILVVDFKSNRPPPESVADVDMAYIKQMAVYRQLLRDVHPRGRIRAALIWTIGPRLMEIPEAMLDEAAKALALPRPAA